MAVLRGALRGGPVDGAWKGSDTGGVIKQVEINSMTMIAQNNAFLRLAGVCLVSINSNIPNQFLYPFYLRSFVAKKDYQTTLSRLQE